jgi:putative membrane protein
MDCDFRYLRDPGLYYMHSVPFFIKMAAFILVGVLSILPTIEFLSWSKVLKTGRLPAITSKRIYLIRSLIHIEQIGVVIIILAAALMAKGVGYAG